MKKQILVFAVLLVAVFFTACEQDALVNPVEDITETQNIELTDLPAEAAEALQDIIDGNYVESEVEERCNTYPSATGSIQRNNSFVWAATKFCTLGVDISGRTNTGQGAYFYFHVDQKYQNGNYYNIVHHSNLSYGSGAGWTRAFSRDLNVPSDLNWRCNYRAYVYIWDAPCGKWTRLKVRYF